jgi:hypothetical protein
MNDPLMLKAVKSKYQSQIDEALATLDIYLNHPVGIGEHSDILLEVSKYVDILDSADSKLATLDKYFGQASKTTYT